MITYTGPLSYNNGVGILKPGDFRISASGIARFYTAPTAWFRENLLGESGFISSTSSVLGTCCHYVAEIYAKTRDFTTANKQEIEDYIVAHTTPGYDLYNAEVDGTIIREQYKIMAQNLVTTYLAYNMPVQVEPFVTEEILPGIFVGGSIDNVSPGMIVDYKTTSTSKIPDSIKFEYKLQLLTYAWILRKQGTPIDRIRIVYISREVVGEISPKTGKQFKSYPSEVKVLTENVTEQDFEYIEGIIHLIAESVDRWKKVPTDRYLLAKDYRLKFSDAPSVTNTNLFAKLSEDD